MKLTVSKPTYVLLVSLLALALSFLILKNPSFELVPGQTFTNSISAVVVPHFDLAAVSRQNLLYQVAEQVTPKTIILVSPNHFDTGGYNITTTTKTWRLQNAYLEADTNKIAKLNINIDGNAFEREHGITNILGPLNNAFPDAKIIPIIIKPETTREEISALEAKLEKSVPNSLLIASVDFSHYQPGSLAEVHDLLSVKALNNLDENLIWDSEVDSNQALALAILWAKNYQTNSFKLLEDTNSGKVANSPDAESTSYILGWFQRGKTVPIESKTFIAGHNLAKYTDVRFAQGVDQKIELTNERDMALECRSDTDFCGLNQIFWNAPFWRETQNGLVVAGEIQANQYKLVLLPTDNQGELLRGEQKLGVINLVRQGLGLPSVEINYGYDTIIISR